MISFQNVLFRKYKIAKTKNKNVNSSAYAIFEQYTGYNQIKVILCGLAKAIICIMSAEFNSTITITALHDYAFCLLLNN